MDTIAPKTPATLPFAAWQALSPAAAAHEVHARVAALSPPLRAAALAWLKPERDLATEIGRWNGLTSGRSQRAQVSALHPLHGIPYLLKDLFDLAGVPTRAGATFLDQVRGTPTRDSALVRQLRALGASCAGKTHLVEFAAGLFGDNSHYGDCPHPQFPDRLSGGSSSGSAALVAAGVVPLAVGTDTGGSVRVPAAWCGLHGFRLTPGDELIRDAFPLAPTMDTAGWFTANAGDMLAVWQAVVGKLPKQTKLRGCFLPVKALGIPFDPETAGACDRAAAAFANPADSATSAALLDSWQGAIEAYTVTALGEAHKVHRDWLAPYRGHYEPGIWQRFSDGGRYPAEQLSKAAATIGKVRSAFRQYFASHDFLILPATPFPALRKADCTPEARRQLLTLTTPASLAGLPVLTRPVPLPSGLSTGLQVILPTASSPVVPWICSGGLPVVRSLGEG